MNLLKALILSSLLLLLSTSCTKRIAPDESDEQVIKYGLVIHGGAGYIYKGRFTSEQDSIYRARLTEALKVGYKILSEGGSSVDAVEKVINVLENSPLFNAGKGAVFASNGRNELDASIMDGSNLNCGAVAGVTTIKNPISLARVVMEKSPHVMMAREGAEKYGEEMGLEIVDNKYFYTDKSWNSLKEAQKAEEEKNLKSANYFENSDYKFGTVGCAALDKNGNLAAGTSTGGMTNKKWGRVGDSPIIGAGTYANNKTCALSATGHGEYFIRNVVTYDISARMEYKGETLKQSADYVIKDKLVKQKGEGGIIGIDKRGNIVMSFNTPGMFRGFITDKNNPTVKLYKDE